MIQPEFGGHGQPGSRTPLSALVRGHEADKDIIKNKSADTDGDMDMKILFFVDTDADVDMK